MRALARWGVTPLLAAPLGAHALGFGDIELQSALNQPFQAQIALVATADELQGLKVNLAAPEVFERYGIEHPGFLARFEFRITTNGGHSVVQVTSREPVTEPFVTLLVEATWSRGRRLREYTVLLDPPVLLPAPNGQAVAPAITRPAAPNASGGGINRPAPSTESTAPAPRPGAPTPSRGEPAPASRPSDTPKSTPTPRALPTSAPGGSYGPVRRAETLWAIADHLRPEGVSVNQMMVAVYRANPHAFGGNMNVLLRGCHVALAGHGRPRAAQRERCDRRGAETKRRVGEPADAGALAALAAAIRYQGLAAGGRAGSSRESHARQRAVEQARVPGEWVGERERRRKPQAARAAQRAVAQSPGAGRRAGAQAGGDAGIAAGRS